MVVILFLLNFFVFLFFLLTLYFFFHRLIFTFKNSYLKDKDVHFLNCFVDAMNKQWPYWNVC